MDTTEEPKAEEELNNNKLDKVDAIGPSELESSTDKAKSFEMNDSLVVTPTMTPTFEATNPGTENSQTVTKTVTGDMNSQNIPTAQFQKPNNRKPLLILIVAVISIIIVSSLSAAAYVGYVVPNKPNNVVKQAVVSAFVPESLKTFGVNASVTNKSDAGESTSKINFVAGTQDSVGRADFTAELSIVKIGGSLLIDSKASKAYLKVNELPTILGLIGLSNAPSLQKKIGNNWLELTTNDVRETAGVDSKNENTSDACLAELGKIVSANSFKNQLTALYDSNSFANASKVGSENVNDIKTVKYKVAIDETKAKTFSQQTVNYVQDQLAKANQKCGSEKSASDVSSTVNNVVNESKLGDVYVWVGPNKILQKIQLNASDKESAIQLELLLNQQNKLDFAIPTNTITIEELQKEIESMFSNQNFEFKMD